MTELQKIHVVLTFSLNLKISFVSTQPVVLFLLAYKCSLIFYHHSVCCLSLRGLLKVNFKFVHLKYVFRGSIEFSQLLDEIKNCISRRLTHSNKKFDSLI